MMTTYGGRTLSRWRRRFMPIVSTLGLLFCIGAVFVLSVKAFRSAPKKTVEAFSEPVSAIAQAEVKEQPLALTAVFESVAPNPPVPITARRAFAGDLYFLQLEAQLPDPPADALFAYEVWLVRETPFDYLSLGMLQKSFENGAYRIDWKGEQAQKLSTYEKIIITQEALDGNTDPGAHVAEGEFKEAVLSEPKLVE